MYTLQVNCLCYLVVLVALSEMLGCTGTTTGSRQNFSSDIGQKSNAFSGK